MANVADVADEAAGPGGAAGSGGAAASAGAGRPDGLRKTEVEQAARLRVAIARLARLLRQRTMSGLTPSQLSCLTSVERLEPVRLAELAAREAVAPPTLTRIVAVLVEIGMVERQPDPDDARAALITTTPAGRAALQLVREERTAFLSDRLHALPAEDRARLPYLVELLEHLAEAAPATDAAVEGRSP